MFNGFFKRSPIPPDQNRSVYYEPRPVKAEAIDPKISLPDLDSHSTFKPTAPKTVSSDFRVDDEVDEMFEFASSMSDSEKPVGTNLDTLESVYNPRFVETLYSVINHSGLPVGNEVLVDYIVSNEQWFSKYEVLLLRYRRKYIELTRHDPTNVDFAKIKSNLLSLENVRESVCADRLSRLRNLRDSVNAVTDIDNRLLFEARHLIDSKIEQLVNLGRVLPRAQSK